MTQPPRAGVPARLVDWADAVLLPCFDGLTAPEWVRRRIGGSMGGVCLFARNTVDADQVAALTAELLAERPSVVIAIDEEAGDVTRLDAATGSRFPGAAALGRADDVGLTRRIAQEAGGLLAAAGVSVNFAPCADVAVDPNNPVIGSRSFGADPSLVSRHTAAWVAGQQEAGVAACAKHFPGHGDTDADTHRHLAVLDADLDRLRAEALPPFAAAIDAGILSIMVGHLLVPAVDELPATVSARWLTEILRGDLGFDGAIVTDALEMAAVADAYGIPDAAVRSLAAGADLLCIGGSTRPEEEIDAIRDTIVAAVLDGTLPEERLADAAARSATVGVAAVRGRAAAGRGRVVAGGQRVVAGESAATDGEPSAPGREPAAAGRESITVAGSSEDGRSGGPDASALVARSALQIAGPLPGLRQPILVIRCTDTPNIAVGVIPWGPAPHLGPESREIVVGPGDALSDSDYDAAASVLVVTRDRHRHDWMRTIVAQVRRRRPDAILIEMGVSGVTGDDAPAIASFGATLANTRAVVDTLTGPTATA